MNWDKIYLVLLKVTGYSEIQTRQAYDFLQRISKEDGMVKIGDKFINEECRIFEVVDRLPGGEYRAKRVSDFSNVVTEFIRFRMDELKLDKEGSFWVLNEEALEARIRGHERSQAVNMAFRRGA